MSSFFCLASFARFKYQKSLPEKKLPSKAVNNQTSPSSLKELICIKLFRADPSEASEESSALSQF